MRILVSGLLNIETTVAVRGFPINYYPIDYTFFGVQSNVAGVGYNIAKALATLGDDVNLISFLGKDAEGRRIREQLDDDGIRADHIISSLKSTPVSAILYDPQGKRQIYCDLKDIQEQMLCPEDFSADLAGSDIAVLCNINFNRQMIRKARKTGVTTAVDVHVLGNLEDEYNRDFMADADILFLSDEALPCAPGEFIRQIHDRYHNKIIVIGMGSQGAMLYEASESSRDAVWIPAYRDVNVVNTVGAGDALFSAFLHYYAKGFAAEEALNRAVIFAAVKIESSGASVGFCKEEEIEKRRQRDCPPVSHGGE